MVMGRTNWAFPSTLLLLLVAACGGGADDEPLGSAEQEIVNGQLTSGDPATVYIDVGCSGTLVTSRVVLTACHCLENSYGPVSVFFGSNINGSGNWINATHYEVHPGACVGSGDLAMLTLSQAGPATPIPINDKNLAAYVGEPMRIVGFGVTGENSGGSGSKREGTTTLASVDAGVMWSNPAGQSGTCYGDSGGPNFMLIDGVEKVTGVTSFGTAACGSGQDAAARTDSYISWIDNYIAAHDPADCGADGQCAAGCPAPDPDCPCADDGYCSAACSNPASDPDCDSCALDGVCDPSCSPLDIDCCAANGECFAACGAQDPDCDSSGSGGSPPGSGSGVGGSAGAPGFGSGADDDPPANDDDGSGRRVWKPDACTVAAARSTPAAPVVPLAWLVLGVMLLRRRR